MYVAQQAVSVEDMIRELRSTNRTFSTMFRSMMAEGYPPEKFIFWLGEFLTLS